MRTINSPSPYQGEGQVLHRKTRVRFFAESQPPASRGILDVRFCQVLGIMLLMPCIWRNQQHETAIFSTNQII
ncbi:hypothetical protein [Nodularia spumigena]|uniref:hypothetical protein n=1 Tax=Nodularia spumigena TaxID=70799 RepID=UPI001379A762|nr:hypothetical protein [Nodularia spumigena]